MLTTLDWNISKHKRQQQQWQSAVCRPQRTPPLLTVPSCFGTIPFAFQAFTNGIANKATGVDTVRHRPCSQPQSLSRRTCARQVAEDHVRGTPTRTVVCPHGGEPQCGLACAVAFHRRPRTWWSKAREIPHSGNRVS